MPFSNIPVRNPGRYFEQFVKVVQPVGGSPTNMSAMQNTPSMAITSNYMTGSGDNAAQNNQQNNQNSQSFGYGNQQQQVAQFKWIELTSDQSENSININSYLKYKTI